MKNIKKKLRGGGGEILITKGLQPQGAARLSALPLSHYSVAKNDENINTAAEAYGIERADMLINRVLGSGRKYDAAEIMRSRNAAVRAQVRKKPMCRPPPQKKVKSSAQEALNAALQVHLAAKNAAQEQSSAGNAYQYSAQALEHRTQEKKKNLSCGKTIK